MSPAVRAAAIWIARLAAGGVFLWACYPKIVDPAGFAKSIFNYQMLPDAAINPLAIFLPWLELVAGIAIIAVPWARRGAALLIGGMLVVFIVAIASAMARGIDISCGCFSTTSAGEKLGWANLALDLFLLACCFIAPRRVAPPSAP